MILSPRVRTIFWKELIDILRDRRTLIAMIVVPIVLYPLLMVGSIQAVSVQSETMQEETFKIGTVGEEQAGLLKYFIEAVDERIVQRMWAGVEPESEEADLLPRSLAGHVEIFALPDRETLESAVRSRAMHAGLIFQEDEFLTDPSRQNAVSIVVDVSYIRGQFIESRLRQMFERIGESVVEARKARQGLPEEFDRPFVLATKDVSAPPSILGQIVPLILILMTVTGAIYPAIDLTAGERERGTLESLMVTPVPVFELIVGKFLVVTTVAILGAALNLLSVTATVYFGGFDILVASADGALPWAQMGLILLCLIPFAVLMSAIMLAVCSCARTFKEAQNYVTPVIFAVLIPGGIAALPATQLDGIMLVMPVGNMVLLARDLLLGTHVAGWHIALVLLSTTLYAAAAVGVAATIFGRESVVFADATTLRASFARKSLRPRAMPSASMSLLIVALLFPTWFFVQSSASPGPGSNAADLLFLTGWSMPLLFVALPVVLLWYGKINLRNALALRMPSGWHLLAGLLIGVSAWVPAQEIAVLQFRWFSFPPGAERYVQVFAETLRSLPPWTAITLMALVPAVCEETLFRGLLISGLSTAARKWTVIVASAVIFGVFHFAIYKFAITALLGLVLGYLCWQARSVIPAMLAHMLHNAISIGKVIDPRWASWLGLGEAAEGEAAAVHLPVHILLIGIGLFVAGLLLASRSRASDEAASEGATATAQA